MPIIGSSLYADPFANPGGNKRHQHKTSSAVSQGAKRMSKNIGIIAVIRWCSTCAVLVVVQLFTAGNIVAQTAPSTPATTDKPAHKYFTDVVLVNQNGEQMRLYSDLLKDKVVIINSFFATCQGTCLPMMRNLQK